jgi:hypothetical protein
MPNSVIGIPLIMLKEETQPRTESVKLYLPISSDAVAFVVILLVTFFAHFVLFPQFGIYEDDYILTLPVMKSSIAELPGHLWETLTHPTFGRPINFFFRWLIFFFTVKDGHLQAGLRRRLGFRAGFVGAIFYLLYPVDASRQILMHQTDMHLGATILLVSFLLYQNKKLFSAFFLAAISLLVCEWWYLPFLAAPLIFPRENRSWRRDLVMHAVIFFAVAGGVFFGRSLLGEQRTHQVLHDVGHLSTRILGACTLGPFISAKAALLRPLDAILHAEPFGYLLGLVSAGLIAFMLWVGNPRQSDGREIETKRDWQTLLLMLFGGLLAWSFSYFLSFLDDYYPPVMTIGRLSAVHAVGAFGAAICFAICFKVAYRAAIPRFFWFLLILLSVYLGSLVAFGVHIQISEYVANRNQQREVWQTIIRQIADVDDGDVVLFEHSLDVNGMPITKGFGPFAPVTYFPMALPYFVNFPQTWREVPRVYGIWQGCEFDDLAQGRRLHTPVWAPTLWPVIRDGHFIYLRVENGQLRRVAGPVQILGREFQPKASSPEVTKRLRLSNIFQNIFGEPDSKKWFTIRKAKFYPGEKRDCSRDFGCGAGL